MEFGCFSIFWNSIFLLSIGIFKPWSHLIAESAKQNKNLCWEIRMCPFCSRHPPVGKGCGGPHVTRCSHRSSQPRAHRTVLHHHSTHWKRGPWLPASTDFCLQGFMEIVGFSESWDTWHGCQMFIHFISTQQLKRKTNHNEQFKDILRTTGLGILMITLLKLLVSYFQRWTVKVIREIPWITPAASIKGKGTGQCHVIQVLFFLSTEWELPFQHWNQLWNTPPNTWIAVVTVLFTSHFFLNYQVYSYSDSVLAASSIFKFWPT